MGCLLIAPKYQKTIRPNMKIIMSLNGRLISLIPTNKVIPPIAYKPGRTQRASHPINQFD